jgi:hypothetical protein
LNLTRHGSRKPGHNLDNTPIATMSAEKFLLRGLVAGKLLATAAFYKTFVPAVRALKIGRAAY